MIQRCSSTVRYCASLALFSLAASTSTTAQTYRIRTLPPPNSSGDSFGLGINDAGVVVGQGFTLSGNFRGLRWIDGVPTELGPVAGHANSLAFDISDDDQVVGTSGSRCGSANPTLWDAGQIVALPDVPRSIVAAYSVESGVAVGQGFDSCSPPWNSTAHMWVYDSQEETWFNITLDPHPGDSDAGAFDIDIQGVPIGFSGDSTAGRLRAVSWIWDSWLMVYLPVPVTDLGGEHSIAFGTHEFTNDDGVPGSRVVGYSQTPDGAYRAFLSQEGALDLGTLPGYAHSAATRLNGAGTVIGHAFNGTDTFWPYSVPLANGRAFVWRDGELHAVSGLIPASSGWSSLNGLRDINERGEIVGYGVRSGRYRAFVLTPECLFRGDLNDDRIIDISDLAALLGDFGCGGFVCPGDITGDGAVDLADLAVQLANFGTNCN